jgi:tetratricopeptide (TPR) repeat protein
VSDEPVPPGHVPEPGEPLEPGEPAPPGDVPEPGEPGEVAVPGEPESAYDLLQRGTRLLRDRHHAQAAVVLERAARLEPGRGSILEALGRAYFNSSQHEPARRTFEALLEVDPSSHYGHFALGQSLKHLGRIDEARTHLRLAVALSPGSALYRSALARLPAPGESS